MVGLTGYSLLPLSLAVPLPLPAIIVTFAIGGFVVELYFIYWTSALQRSIPSDVLGKVLALDQLSAYALLPVGFAIVPPLAAALGEREILIIGGLIVIGSSLLSLVVPGVADYSDPVRVPGPVSKSPAGPPSGSPAELP
jgi:hypothetical protein